MPATVTSSAFIAPSVVPASSVSDAPGCAFRLRASPAPSITAPRSAPASSRPASTVRKGPLTANSASGSMPTPIMITDLSPLLISPPNSTRGSTWRTAGSASSRWRSACASVRPCCSGVSSKPSNCAVRASTRWPVVRAEASARPW